MQAAYDDHDRARRAAEPPKAAGLPRSPFERDRARVLHSSALRRLAAKTQVVGIGVDDFPRTRLTHSLECAQIGRELGAALGADPDVVEAACLAHDLGHPPFGHNGEDALDAALRAVAPGSGGFEGNAQSFRILVRLEAKAYDDDGMSVGLNLTRAVLDGSVKYPWRRRDDTSKYNVYDEDLEAFAWTREGAPSAEARTVEAQIMDWSDDVAYSVHDLEDGIHAGHIDLATLASPAERAAVAHRTASAYSDLGPDALASIFDGLLSATWWPSRFDGTHRALAGLKRMTSELIARFCAAAYDTTRAAYPGPLSRYDGRLVVPERARAECALLKGVALHYVMDREQAHVRQAAQRDVVTELVSLLATGAPGALDPALRDAWTGAADDVARLRIVADQVAALTDTSAMESWRRLTSGRT